MLLNATCVAGATMVEASSCCALTTLASWLFGMMNTSPAIT
ncbi:MAG: hypothetical protein QM739_18620 [Propionivibrio sp.]